MLNLPPGAMLWHALGVDAAWTPGEHIGRLMLHQLEGANWQRGDGKGAAPKPIPSPSEQHESSQRAERHSLRAERFLAKQRREE